MERQMLHFGTPYGDYYYVTKEGYIVRHPNDTPSTKWVFLGLSHVKRRHHIPRVALTPEFLKTFNPCWKNGKPQWTVMDLDHGTRGEWGNTSAHGVKFICRANRKGVSMEKCIPLKHLKEAIWELEYCRMGLQFLSGAGLKVSRLDLEPRNEGLLKQTIYCTLEFYEDPGHWERFENVNYPYEMIAERALAIQRRRKELGR